MATDAANTAAAERFNIRTGVLTIYLVLKAKQPVYVTLRQAYNAAPSHPFPSDTSSTASHWFSLHVLAFSYSAPNFLSVVAATFRWPSSLAVVVPGISPALYLSGAGTPVHPELPPRACRR